VTCALGPCAHDLPVLINPKDPSVQIDVVFLAKNDRVTGAKVVLSGGGNGKDSGKLTEVICLQIATS
jgi:hypothetical protein